MFNIKFFFFFSSLLFLVACGGGILGDVDNLHPSQKAPKKSINLVLDRDENNQLLLGWDDQQDAQNYILYMSNSDDFFNSETNKIILDEPFFRIQESNDSLTFFIKVRSNWFDKQGPDSNIIEVVSPPLVPLNLVVMKTAVRLIELIWDVDENIDTYTLYRFTQNVLDIKNDETKVFENVTSPFKDIEIEINQDYYYWLIANNNDQDSAFSKPAFVRVTSDEINQIPEVLSSNTFSFNENSILDFTVVANDPEAQPITFQISGGDDASLFSLDIDNGSLTLAGLPDFEEPRDLNSDNIYEVTIEISDGENLVNQSIKISVLDIDESVINEPPIADAGTDQSLKVGSLVTLDGSASYAIGNDPSVSYRWMAPDGITLSAIGKMQPTFILPIGNAVDTVFMFDLVVTDRRGIKSLADRINIVVANSDPVANAGRNQVVKINDVVRLNGDQSSDPNNDKLTYTWVTSSNIRLSDPDSISPSFTVPNDLEDKTTLIFELTVTDNNGAKSTADSVSISVTSIPAPISDAGPDQSAKVGKSITLDASASTAFDDGPITYRWSPPKNITLSNNTDERPGFILPRGLKASTKLLFELIVTNKLGVDSVSDSVEITVENSIPSADAGLNQSAFVNDNVELDGGASDDPNDDTLSFRWSTESDIVLSDIGIEGPTFLVPVGTKAGTTFEFQLSVSDSIEKSIDRVNINVLNTAPVADAGKDIITAFGQTVRLDGSDSRDVNKDVLSYSWSIISFPKNSNATINNRNEERASFSADAVGEYLLELAVDDQIDVDVDIIKIDVTILVPAMVSIANGSFRMGDETSADGETQGEGADNEVPVHTVDISAFEIGKYEVTFEEYDQYLKNRIRNSIADPSSIKIDQEAYDLGLGRELLPVVYVSKVDIQGYLNWLNVQLGIDLDDPKRYRLPSEAEWEYAARAGTIGTYNTGDCIDTNEANFSNREAYIYLKADLLTEITCIAPDFELGKAVGTDNRDYDANDFGVFHMHGNTWEWVEDCWHDSYKGAPTDGSVWKDNCTNSRSVVRGGSWDSVLFSIRSAFRGRSDPSRRLNRFGFRLAKSRG